MYEVAARALTGNNDFAMPYWDWTAQPDFPAAFGDATFDGAPNPLFVAGRAMQTGDELDPAVVGQAVMDGIFATIDYELFGTSRATRPEQPRPVLDHRHLRHTGDAGSSPHTTPFIATCGGRSCAAAPRLRIRYS